MMPIGKYAVFNKIMNAYNAKLVKIVDNILGMLDRDK